MPFQCCAMMRLHVMLWDVPHKGPLCCGAQDNSIEGAIGVGLQAHSSVV